MVFETIRDIIAEKLEIDKSQIKPDSRFDDMRVDSLYMVEIMLSIEESFDIIMDDVDEMESISDLVEYVEQKLA